MKNKNQNIKRAELALSISKKPTKNENEKQKQKIKGNILLLSTNLLNDKKKLIKQHTTKCLVYSWAVHS